MTENENNRAESRATQVDAGWRGAATSAPKATQVDAGWRGASAGAPATQVDDGWRGGASDLLGSESVMSGATANFFSNIDAFKDEVEKLTELKSSTGILYRVQKTISRAGGESIILLCADPNGNDVVAKVYYESVNGAGSSIATRSHVLEYMGTEEGKQYTLAVSEIGLVEFGESKYYFEIMPYCPNADLSGYGALPFEKIVQIAEQLNEALHSIHKVGIIHRDIKPENLYDIDGYIKLGDFGIAKNGAAGRSNYTVHILGTEGYAAPETRRYVYHEKSDYYSMGVTLATLFEGHFVFENMNHEMQSLAQESERLPLLRVDPHREKLENLLNGLCRIDPKRRFGYEDVKKWLANHEYTGAHTIDESWPKAYRMLDDAYHDEQSMFEGITKDKKHWEEAKKMLYGGKMFEQFFVSFRPDLARAAQDVEETYRAVNGDKGLSVFLKTLFAPGPIVWKGYTFHSLSELAEKMVVTQTPSAYGELLKNKCLSHWLSHTEGVTADEQTMRLVDEIETAAQTEPELACYWFGNSFAPKKSLTLYGKEVSTIQDAIAELLRSPKDFYTEDGCEKLLDRVAGADLYGFLSSFGYKAIIDATWAELKPYVVYQRSVFLFSMLDDIAVKANADATIVRNFFVDYGPIGIETYTRKLVMQNEPKVYEALDAAGRHCLSKIASFKAPTSGSVNELYRAYLPLGELVSELRRILVENPHCITSGVYDDSGVICSNLMGCFAFKIYERVAPLGFQAWLGTTIGGEEE